MNQKDLDAASPPLLSSSALPHALPELHYIRHFKSAAHRESSETPLPEDAGAQPLGHEEEILNEIGGGKNQDKVDKLILDKLGSSYKKDVRPIPDSSVWDGTHRIKVYMGLSFRKLLALDQIHGTLSMVVWLRLMWPDYRLRYNASEYFKDVPMFSEGAEFSWNSSTDFVPLEQSTVWVPDIQILNAVEESQPINQNPRIFWYDETKLKTMGYNMVLVSPEIIHVQCPMDLSRFPFDTQSCEIQFGDWSASEQYFEFDVLNRFSQEWSLPDSEFKVESATVEKTNIQEHSLVADAHLPVVTYKVQFTRRPHYYLVKFVLPMFLLVLLGQAVYWMDLEKERFSTGITVILAVMTVSFLTAPLMPKTPEVMWLETFQVGCYVLTCLPMFASILIDHMKIRNHHTDEQMELIDAVARVVHPILVIFYYFAMFGVPGFSFAYWPLEVPEVAWFFFINLTIFLIFLVSGIAGLHWQIKQKSVALPQLRSLV